MLARSLLQPFFAPIHDGIEARKEQLSDMTRVFPFPRIWIVAIAVVFTVWLPGADDPALVPACFEHSAAASFGAAVPDADVNMGYRGRWRYTRFGWQDLNDWIPPASIRPTGLEQIHPVLMAAGVFLGTLGVMLWCSEEWDAARWLEGPDSVCRRRRPRPPCVTDYLPESSGVDRRRV